MARILMPARWLAMTLALILLTLAGCSQEDRAPRSQEGSEAASPSAAPTSADAQERRQPVRRPRTAGQALRQLVAAETAIADPSTGPGALRRAARQQQLAYRELGNHPGWDKAVMAGLPRKLRSTVRDNVASRREFRDMHTSLADTLPAWRIIAPAPAEELLGHYRHAERTHGIGWEYLAAINLVETGMGRIRGTSVAGARGPMQFMPATWAEWGRGDINDPRDAIMAAARYLAHNGGARGRMPQALYRYNNDVRYVRGVTHLARVMEREPRAFYGYYHWDIYYLTTRGDVRLPVGYHQERPVPVDRYLDRAAKHAGRASR